MAVLAACGSADAEPDVDLSAGQAAELSAPEPPAPATLTFRPSPTPTPTLEPEPDDEPAAEPATNPVAEISGTFSVRIPQLGVTAPVVPITMSVDRVLEPPRDPAVVGWWSEGAGPGASEGSAVLVGHSTRAGSGGAFDDVGALSSGDTIEVEGADDKLAYRVESNEVVSKDDLARRAQEIFNQSGPGRLVVITCEDWDGSVWRSNIVTIATPV